MPIRAICNKKKRPGDGLFAQMNFCLWGSPFVYGMDRYHFTSGSGNRHQFLISDHKKALDYVKEPEYTNTAKGH